MLRIFDVFFFKRNGFLPKLYKIFESEMPLLRSQRKGCFFKLCPRTLIYTIVATKYQRLLIANGDHDVGRCILS